MALVWAFFKHDLMTWLIIFSPHSLLAFLLHIRRFYLLDFAVEKFNHFLNCNFKHFSNLINFIMKKSLKRVKTAETAESPHLNSLHKILMTSKFNNSFILSPRNLFNCYSLNIVINGFASLIISEKSIFIVLIIFLMRGNDFLCEIRQHEKAIFK